MKFKIVPVHGSKELKAYIDFPHELYAGDKNYVPELFMAQKDMLNPKKNPFFEHAEVQCYLAYDGDKLVGRISAIHNKNYNEYHNVEVGFFGFFDVINDYEVAKALLDTAADWCKKKGLTAVIGPTNLSTNDTAGILIEGFHEPPKIMMTYNAPYYQTLLEKYGMVKDMDLYAYILYTAKASEKSIRLAQSLEERLAQQGIIFRNVNLKDFYNEVAKIRTVYNDAWKKNWGFVPWTDSEIKHLADNLKMLVNENWCFIAEFEGQPIGFAITLNDINEITKNFKKGRLFPFNIFKLLAHKHKTQFVRILALGVSEGFRKKGIEAIFFAKNILAARKYNVTAGEVSWVLENNEEMNASALKLNSELYKTYRIYRYELHS